MAIFYFMIGAVPNPSNPESEDFGGAYINFWINSATENEALMQAKASVRSEDWSFICVEDRHIAHRSSYLEDPESLECYDEACAEGISSVFYTWPIDEHPVN